MSAAQLRAHTRPMDQAPDPEVLERPKPPRQQPATYKLRILEEYEQLDTADKGGLLRLKALYTSPISDWRKQRDKGAPAEAAYAAHTERFVRKPPVPPRLSEAVWINKPPDHRSRLSNSLTNLTHQD